MKIYKLLGIAGLFLGSLGCATLPQSSAQQKNVEKQKTSSALPQATPIASPPVTSSESAAADTRLERFSPQLEIFEPDAANISYAADVPLKTVKLLADFPPERLNSKTYPQLYKMPLADDIYLAAISKASQINYVLFKDKDTALIELGRSRQLDYDAIMDTTFFAGNGRVLVVAGVGTPPDFEGLEVFEFKNEKLNYLGAIKAAKKEKGTGIDGDYVNPLDEAATAEYKSGIYHITMKGELYGVWGLETKEKKIAAPDLPVTFRFDGKRFRIVKQNRIGDK